LALIYADLLRAYDELYGDNILSTLWGKTRRLLGKLRRSPRVIIDSTTALSDEEIRLIFASIGRNGQRMMLEICRRIKRGHDTYGDFPKRQWSRERSEELQDALVYEVAEELQSAGQLEDPKE
jgi:hypothetical protein